MKKPLLLLLLFSISHALFYNAYSKGVQLSVEFMPLTNQLPSNSVQRIFQDKIGFIWFGTLDGICRYDGNRLLTFRSDVANPDLLTNNEITCIAQDHRNFLWIGTKKGLNLLDMETYHIEHFDLPELNQIEIRDIVVTRDSNIWVGTQQQVIRFNPDHSVQMKYDSSLPTASVNCIYEDCHGNIWVAMWGNGLFLYDKGLDTFRSMPKVGLDNNPFKLQCDHDGRLWMCTWSDGLFLIEQNEQEYVYLCPDIKRRTLPTDEKCYFSIVQDQEYGYLWVVSRSGLYALKYIDEMGLEEMDISPLQDKTNNIFSEIKMARDGSLWVATFGEGAFTINFKKPVVTYYSMNQIKEKTGITPSITTLFEDQDGNLWFNQNRYGLCLWNMQTDTLTLYQEIPSIKNLPGLSPINCISGFRSLPGEVWVGSGLNQCIYVLGKKDNNIVLLYTIDLSNVSASPCGAPIFFFEDRRNNIWIVSQWDKVFVKPHNSMQIKLVDLSLHTISGIAEDTQGNLWFSTATNGIYRVEKPGNLSDSLQVTHYTKENSNLTSNNAECICADLSGNIWIGLKEGNIVHYNILDTSFTDISASFPMINEGILNITADDTECLWISTNKRVIEYSPENKNMREYSVGDELKVNSIRKGVHCINNSGKVLIGGNNGIIEFTPSERSLNKADSINVYLTDIKVENHSVFTGNENHRFNPLKQIVHFEPEDKNFEIDFSTLNYTFPQKVQYAYKLDGIDGDWVYTKGNRQFAFYNRLKKGTHTFYLKATDENGVWGTNIMELKIYKRPAFYETWWAFLLYCVTAATILYITLRIIRKRINLRNELKIAQIEKEKSEELTQSKLRYFTNISHDFMTPLTIISCLIDDAEMSYKGKIAQFDTMRSNVRRLQRLLQQVLDFRKVESGNMKLKLSYGDIVEFIHTICRTHFEPIMQKKHISFTFHASKEHILAFFDQDKIDKIIFNLLSNAYKYTPEQGEIKLELDLKDEHILIIRISDTGIGISEVEQEKIFTRFYTNSKGRTKDSNGIGLSLTKDLLELHHGTIRVSSSVGQGSVFTVTIPIDSDSYSATEISNVDQTEIARQSLGLLLPQTEYETLQNEEEYEQDKEKAKDDSINLLLAEDNEELLSVLSKILSKHYTVFMARNGVEALDIVKKHNIDIVVCDVMMPEMDGFEVTRTLKGNMETSHIPVILLTAKNSTEDRVTCYNIGADGYISKPFELKVLEARINNFINHKKDLQKQFKTNADINISTLEYPSSDTQFLNNAIKIIEADLMSSNIDVNAFAEKLNMSKSSLYRKMKTMTGLAPNEFIRNIRLKHACRMLKSPNVSISEVAYSTGFSDPKYFTYCFKNEFGMTPREYQKSTIKESDENK